MFVTEMKKLVAFMEGYKKLCQETGVHLIVATGDGALRPTFHRENNEVIINYLQEIDLLSCEVKAT